MDEIGTSKEGEPQSSAAAESLSSPASVAIAKQWRPSQLIFSPYSPDTNAKPQNLRVVVRRPVSVFPFSFSLYCIFRTCIFFPPLNYKQFFLWFDLELVEEYKYLNYINGLHETGHKPTYTYTRPN